MMDGIINEPDFSWPTELDQLRAENAALRAQLEAARAPTGFDAEFLAKRLQNVARLVGAKIPESFSNEQVCEYAGTALGEIARLIDASRAQEPVALPFAILEDEMAALKRFHECVTDGEGYDVPKAMMKQLSEIGLLRRCSGNYYEHTTFGLSVLNGDFNTHAPDSAARIAELEAEVERLKTERTLILAGVSGLIDKLSVAEHFFEKVLHSTSRRQCEIIAMEALATIGSEP